MLAAKAPVGFVLLLVVYALVRSSIGQAAARRMGWDLNGDGVVDGADLSILLGEWNQASEDGDLNSDGIVDGADLTILLGNWGPCPG